MRTRLAVSALILAAVSSFAAPADSPAPVVIRFDSGDRTQPIPIELTGSGLPLVACRLGESKLWFLLNTASPSVLGTKAATRANLLGQGQGATTGAPRSESGTRTEVIPKVSLRLAGADIDQFGVASFNLDPLQTVVGHPVDGILGTEFFEGLVVIVDYAASTIELCDPRAFRYAGRGQDVPLIRQGGLAYLRASVKLPLRSPLEGDFLINSASDQAVILFSPFVAAHRLLNPNQKAEGGGDSSGGGGTLTAVLRAEEVAVKPFTFLRPIVELSRSTTGLMADREHAGLVGGAILSRFRVIWDYSRNRAILEKNAHFGDPFLYDASGISLSAQGPDLSTFEIRRVAPGSPGALANVAVGDVLLAVDGKPVKEITLSGIRKLFQQDGKEYVLSVLRGGTIEKLHLKCQRML